MITPLGLLGQSVVILIKGQMKKGIQKNNPVIALWQKVILDGRIPNLARQYRLKIGIPAYGFDTFEEFDVWHNELEKTKSREILDKNLSCFTDDLKSIIPYEGIIQENSFKFFMFKFLIFGKIENEDLISLRDSGMGIVTVKNSKLFYPPTKRIVGEVDDGVYLKIKDFSTIQSIIEYIESNKDHLRNSLEIYAKSEGLIKPKRIKSSLNFERDKRILALSKYPKRILEEVFNVKGEYKYTVISKLLNMHGYKGVTSSIVRAVQQRSKIKQKDTD